MRLALAEIDEGQAHNVNVQMSRGWKLFLLETLLVVSPIASVQASKGGNIPKAQLHWRFEAFSRGEWASQMACGQECKSRGAQACSRRGRRPNHDDMEASSG